MSPYPTAPGSPDLGDDPDGDNTPDPGLYPFNPDWCVAPAGTVREIIRERPDGLLAKAAARADPTTSLARETVALALAAQPLTADHFRVLTVLSGVRAQFWANLEGNYRHGLATGLKDVTPAEDLSSPRERLTLALRQYGPSQRGMLTRDLAHVTMLPWRQCKAELEAMRLQRLAASHTEGGSLRWTRWE